MQNKQNVYIFEKGIIIESENDHRFGVKSIIFEKITKNMFLSKTFGTSSRKGEKSKSSIFL